MLEILKNFNYKVALILPFAMIGVLIIATLGDIIIHTNELENWALSQMMAGNPTTVLTLVTLVSVAAGFLFDKYPNDVK